MMNIALGFDSNFAPYAAVTIKSILLYNKNVKFYIMYDKGLKKSDIKNISSLIKTGENCTVEWFDMTGKFDHLSAGGWKSNSVYFPVALSSICPDDRILFLDADILVTGNLENLYNQHLDGYYFAGAQDIGIFAEFFLNRPVTSVTFGGNLYFQDYFKKLFNYSNANDFRDYINGGIMLYNLKEMRADDIENKMYALFNQIDFAFNEQDCFNYISKGKKKLLTNKEAILILHNYVIDVMPEIEKQEYLNNLLNTKPLLVHLIKKPWLFPDSPSPYSKMFCKIRNQTPIPYKYRRNRKEILKCKVSSQFKYLYLFGKKIFDTRKDINKYGEPVTTK